MKDCPSSRELAVIVERDTQTLCLTIVSCTIILVWVKCYADRPLIIIIWDEAILFLHAGKGHLSKSCWRVPDITLTLRHLRSDATSLNVYTAVGMFE